MILLVKIGYAQLGTFMRNMRVIVSEVSEAPCELWGNLFRVIAYVVFPNGSSAVLYSSPPVRQETLRVARNVSLVEVRLLRPGEILVCDSDV